MTDRLTSPRWLNCTLHNERDVLINLDHVQYIVDNGEEGSTVIWDNDTNDTHSRTAITEGFGELAPFIHHV